LAKETKCSKDRGELQRVAKDPRGGILPRMINLEGLGGGGSANGGRKEKGRGRYKKLGNSIVEDSLSTQQKE